MNADERLKALKKAYADIILNTAKESAARIMRSERKSIDFQNELHAVKGNSLWMMLRLKHMMDSKISEAKTVSLSQQRKIEQLEAQLEEAEDIVVELRLELRQVIDKLEKMTKQRAQHLSQNQTATSEIERSNSNQINEAQNIIHSGHSCIQNTVLPSIISRNKGRDQCKNFLDRVLHTSEQVNDVRNGTSVIKDEESERISEEPICEVQNSDETTESVAQSVKEKDIQNAINKDEELTDNLVDAEKASLSSLREESKASNACNELPSRAPSERIIKYFFQRKRKRESSSGSNESVSPEDSNSKRKMEMKPNGLPETEGNMIAEPSRDSLPLAEDAQQQKRESSSGSNKSISPDDSNSKRKMEMKPDGSLETLGNMIAEPSRYSLPLAEDAQQQKRESSSGSNESISPEDGNSKRKMEMKPNGSLETQGNMIAEPSRDSLPLAEDAEQVIYL